MTRRLALAGVAALGLAAFFEIGPQTVSMSHAADPSALTWQGAAGRTPQRFLVLRVDGVSKDGGGLFGIRQSPSIAGSFPDATIIEASGEAGRRTLHGPGAELPTGLATGTRIAVGLVDETHFISVLLPPASVSDESVPAWAATQTR